MSVLAPRRRALLAGVVPIAAAAAVMVTPQLAMASTTAAHGATSHTLYASGSDTTYAMMQKLDSLYGGQRGCTVVPTDASLLPDGSCQSDYTGEADSNATHDTVTERYPVGSGSGIKQLCNQGLAGVPVVDFARSSRAIKTSDCDGLKAVAYAQDGISWWHSTASTSSSASLHDLTKAQLVNIYNGTLKTWHDVDPSLPANNIVIYSVQAGSGTRSTFDSYLGGDSTQAIPAANKPGGSGPSHVIFENDASPIFTNGDQNDAIYFYSIGRFTQKQAQSPQPGDVTGGELGALDGVAADTPDVKNGTFPARRSLFNVYRYAPEFVTSYIGERTGFLCRDDLPAATRAKVEQQISSEGFVPFADGSIGGGVSGTSFCRLTQTLDTSAPSVALTPTGGFRGAATATFSELVNGVGASSFGERVTGTTTPLAGTVTCYDLQQVATACTNPVKSARFTPSAGYVPGEKYEVFATASAISDRAGNTLTATPAVAFRGPLAVQDVNVPPVAYTAGWTRLSSSAASGGTWTRSATKNAYALMTFRSTSLTYGYLRTTASGVAKVYVDGVLKATVNEYGSTARSAVTISHLTDARHTVKIVVVGAKSAASKGAFVSLDSLTVS
ncbi:ABC-type phosphate transport system substrate-binding protein [Phycicoccus badiiscoriae]|uniref:ABC-type phosphate transport system substrate-binding protein n=1 Tax=Pedococcus badiiscoriae TaxID=642776 RepID=A0A852WEW9_9MICO|nr:ABC-type phosphate transport system substrate-binding protein [Pedococcus badiiscoriae]